MSIPKIEHFMLPEHTNSLYKEEAISSIGLTHDVAEKINELVDAYNNFFKTDTEWKQTQEGIIRKGVLYMKDNLINTMNDLMNLLLSNGYVDDRLREQTATLSAQLNNLVGKVKEGTTTMDAEIIDGRVLWDGASRNTFGDAVRFQFNSALKGARKIISADSYSTICSSANDVTRNTVYFIHSNIKDEMFANLPTYGEYGLLVTIAYTPSDDNGLIQMYANKDEMYFRFEFGSGESGNWGEWMRLNSHGDGATNFALGASDVSIDIDHTARTLSITGTGIVWSANKFLFVRNITEKSVSLETGETGTYLVYIRDNKLEIVSATKYIPARYDIIISHLYLNSNGDVNWNIWTVNNSTYDHVADRTCSIFKRVCCCGDSYTEGYIKGADGIAYETNHDFAYPAFMSSITGNEYINCGHSGATSLSWVTDARGLPAAREAGVVQAYLLSLGLNDVNNVPLGTAEDIGTSAKTYYGGMSKVIRELASISPNAFIFVQTMPVRDDNHRSYNTALREIVEAYSDTYHVHLLDLYNYADYYSSDIFRADFINGHYTAIGYQKMAELLTRIWSKYINDHIPTFQNVHTIPYAKKQIVFNDDGTLAWTSIV